MTKYVIRVKAIDVLSVALPKSEKNSRSWTKLVATVSSDGWIRIFDLGLLPSSSSASRSQEEKAEISALECVASYDTKGSRLTCCTIAEGELPSKPSASVKRKRNDHQSDDEPSSAGEEFKGFGEDESDDDS